MRSRFNGGAATVGGNSLTSRRLRKSLELRREKREERRLAGELGEPEVVQGSEVDADERVAARLGRRGEVRF